MSWICPKCETENPDGLKVCEVCDSLRIEEPVEEIKKIYTHPAYVEFMKYHYHTMKNAHYGNSCAQYELAEWLRNDVAGNRKLAVQWYFKAAIRGMVSAQYWLAYHYNMGIGTEKNIVEAEKWFLKAAQKGHTISQYELGLIYEKQENYEAAKKWYASVAARGNKNAQKRLEIIENKEKITSAPPKDGVTKTTSVTSSSSEDYSGRIFGGIALGAIAYSILMKWPLKEWGIPIPDDWLQFDFIKLIVFMLFGIVIVFLVKDFEN